MAKAADRALATSEGFSEEERADLATFLVALKTWWQTPLTATGEAERLRALVDSIERVRQIIRR